MRKDNLITACFVPKLGTEKGGNEHVAEILEKGQSGFGTENSDHFLSGAWKITRKVTEGIPNVASSTIVPTFGWLFVCFSLSKCP